MIWTSALPPNKGTANLPPISLTSSLFEDWVVRSEESLARRTVRVHQATYIICLGADSVASRDENLITGGDCCRRRLHSP